MGKKMAKLAIVLHSHLPKVVGHGVWPFGEEWIYEIAQNSYIPLIRSFRRLMQEGIKANVAVSVTPVLISQLGSDAFKSGFADYLKDRISRILEDRTEFLVKGRTELARLTFWMEQELDTVREEFESMGRDIPAALVDLHRQGAIELATSAATHGYLPLLSKEKSINLQLRVGRCSFIEHTGISPAGFWFPECAYKPGLERFVEDEGYKYTVLDAFAIRGGKALSYYGDSTRHETSSQRPIDTIYRIRDSEVVVFPRHPELCSQVWSKWVGYPGDYEYREFHKQRSRSGMRYWRVSDHEGRLETKQTYRPEQAFTRAREHAAHFASRIRDEAMRSESNPAILTVAFDTELYGHWWYEGPAFLEETVRQLKSGEDVRLCRPSDILASTDVSALARIEPKESSWGVDCDHSTWFNDATRPMWERIWEMEEIVSQSWVLTPFGPWPGDVWNLQAKVDTAIAEFLLATSSDWEFLIFTGTAGEYPWERFEGHRAQFAEAYEGLRKALGGRGLPEYQYVPYDWSKSPGSDD